MQETGTGTTTPLTQMRLVLVTFSLGLVACGAAVLSLAGSDGDAEGLAPPVAAGAVIAVAVAGWLLVGLLGPRLNCETAAMLVGSYRSRFFLRVAYSEAAALAGFVVSMMAGEPWPYFLGVACTAVGFARAAPTARNLARDQEALSAAGCAHPLAATLGAPADSAPPTGPIS